MDETPDAALEVGVYGSFRFSLSSSTCSEEGRDGGVVDVPARVVTSCSGAEVISRKGCETGLCSGTTV